MHVFFTVVVWIFIALIALLILFLILPICINVKMDYDIITVKLRILFLTFNLYPRKKKQDKADEQKEKQDDNESPEGKAKNSRKSADKNTLDKILGIISTVGGAVKIILKGLFITHIEVVLPIHKEDPAETGIAYGKAQAYCGATVATLENYLHMSFKIFKILPDFTGEYKYTRYFYCNIWGTPFIIVIAAIYALKKAVKENLI